MEDLSITVRDIVIRLQERGLSPAEISQKMDSRVSARTIYRWAKGEHAPQQRSDLTALKALLIASE
jgi:transposase